MSDVFTQVSAMVEPVRFNKYFLQRKMELSALYRSGIIVRDAAIDTLAQGGGSIIHMPYFNDLTGNSQNLDDTNDLVVAAISTSEDKARLLARAGVFGETDLAGAIAGDDPMAAIGTLFAGWWVRDDQVTLTNILDGVFASNIANNNSDLVLNVSAVSGDGGCLTNDNLEAAAQMLGDQKGNIAAYAMNSACESILKKQYGGVTYNPSEKPGVLATLNGRSVIMDDNIPYNTGTKVATIYLFARGAVAEGNGTAPVPYETGREPLKMGGRSYLVQRRHFLLHVRGIKWNEATCAKKFPTNAELANASNWTRVYEKKAIRVVKLIVRAEAAAATVVTVQTTPALPAMTSAATKSGQVGVPLSLQVTASNASVAQYSLFDACPGLTINASTGEISGTPEAASQGTYDSTVAIKTAVGTTNATVTFTIAAAE